MDYYHADEVILCAGKWATTPGRVWDTLRGISAGVLREQSLRD